MVTLSESPGAMFFTSQKVRYTDSTTGDMKKRGCFCFAFLARRCRETSNPRPLATYHYEIGRTYRHTMTKWTVVAATTMMWNTSW